MLAPSLAIKLGDARFFAALRGLLERFCGRDMRLDDIRAAFLRSAPNSAALAIDLDTPGRPLEVRLDPRYRLLLWRPEYGPRPGS